MSFFRHAIFLFYTTILYLARGGLIVPVLQISRNETNVANGEITETHHAICKIATENLEANAHATFSRVLTKACDSRAVEDKIDHLTRNITEQLKDIRILINRIFESSETGIVKNSLKNHNLIFGKEQKEERLRPRLEEINEYNNTVREMPFGNETASAFVYYWNIENLTDKLASWETGRQERSGTFYMIEKHYAMYLSLTPRYFPDGTLFVGVGITRGRYDAILRWPFPYKIQIHILDLSHDETREDKISRIWDPTTICSNRFWGEPLTYGNPDNPECVGLSVPRQAILSTALRVDADNLRESRYIWNGSMSVKLVIYL